MRRVFHVLAGVVMAGAMMGAEGPPAGEHAAASAKADPLVWMEELRGDRVMAWVTDQNARSQQSLTREPIYADTRAKVLEVLNSREKIPGIEKLGSHLYNFWRDDKNPRGLWRRTTMTEYRKAMPLWETVLDLDALAASEKENWVWGGAAVLEVPSGEPARALVQLSRGGGDAEVVREFDLQKKAFVEGGFTLPEAKSRIAWKDADTLLVGTNFGPGSLTTSGYPRLIKEWKRGAPLASAPTVFEGKPTDMSASPYSFLSQGTWHVRYGRQVTFFTDEEFVLRGNAWVQIQKPADADTYTFADKLLLRLRTDWEVLGKRYKGGSLLAGDLNAFLNANAPPDKLDVLFEPTERTALAGVSTTKNYVVLNLLDKVASRTLLLRPASGRWTTREMETVPLSTVSVSGLDNGESDEVLVQTTGYLTPSTLALADVSKPGAAEVLKQLPSFFDASGLEVQQFEATSKDGTKVPYFQVGRKNLSLDGRNPTLMYGYGGFLISLRPGYSAEVGRSWLEKGGVYVVANIRGGGEFGPAWHNAARKENRQRAYDDFIAVAEDLQKRKVTSPPHLGIKGGSNGGLLMGVMLTQRPDLFGAVVIGSPLLDMDRYIYLPAGASWIDEYGDPTIPAERAFISKYSPYQNIRSGTTYPPVLITTSTMDDRVHPGHARKFGAKLLQAGHNILYYENTEGGHSAAANYEQRAHITGLEYAFLWRVLGNK